MRCDDVNGSVYEVTAVVTQDDSAASKFSGIFDFTLRDAATGKTLCSSTYDVEYSRQ